MSNTTQPGQPNVRRAIRDFWNTTLTIYYANSISWRALKSGGLLFLGFFVWAGSNILYSYLPGLTILQYPIAYGFLLIIYGPIHHIVVIPLALRWRRSQGTKQRIGRRLPNTMLTLFVVAIVVLGTFPVGPMTIDFTSAIEGSGADINPDLACVKDSSGSEAEVHCHFTDAEGVSRIEVQSGGEVIAEDSSPPFEFTIRESEMDTVVGNKQFIVEVYDENGEVARRYTRKLSMIQEN